MVPAEPRAARRRLPAVLQLQALLRRDKGAAAGRAAALAAVLTSVTGLAAWGALLLAQMQAAHWGR